MLAEPPTQPWQRSGLTRRTLKITSRTYSLRSMGKQRSLSIRRAASSVANNSSGTRFSPGGVGATFHQCVRHVSKVLRCTSASALPVFNCRCPHHCVRPLFDCRHTCTHRRVRIHWRCCLPRRPGKRVHALFERRRPLTLGGRVQRLLHTTTRVRRILPDNKQSLQDVRCAGTGP